MGDPGGGDTVDNKDKDNPGGSSIDDDPPLVNLDPGGGDTMDNKDKDNPGDGSGKQRARPRA